MYIYTNIYEYIYIYIYMCVCVYIYTDKYKYTYICMHNIHICIQTHTSAYMYL